MSLDSDYIVDRRRMRRKLTFWRVLAVLVAIIGIVAAAARFGGDRFETFAQGTSPYIARVKINGLIRSDAERTESLDRLAKSSAKAVIVHVNSPGGSTAGSEQLHDALRRVSEKKPVVVVVEGLAASGGYIAAMAADRIVAQETSLVGSIGVLAQYPNVSELMKTLGIKVEQIKSSPLKAAPNGFEPTSPEARAALEAVVLDTYDWFKRMVRDRRRMDDALLARVSDGRVFTGRQAMDLKLIDALGNETTALDWLQKEKGIDPKTRVTDWKLNPKIGDLSFLRLVAASAFEAMGFADLARRIEDSGTYNALERLNLDGLLALWHPPAAD